MVEDLSKIKPGDKIEIGTEEESYVGTYIPQKGDSVVLKLDHGYNIGIDKKKIKQIKLIEEYKEKTPVPQPVKFDKSLPKISILHTGGTIASKVDYNTGGVIARFSPEELVGMFPEIKKIANISSRLISNMWSDDMRFAHYNIMAAEIRKEIESGAEGVIVTQGTDTMHYTAAALSFVLEGLGKPVLVVGAQRSSDRGSSDAALNLISACNFIAKSDFGEVAICMHKNTDDETCIIIPGTKARKMSTNRRDTFRPINTVPWANVDFKTGKIEFLRKGYSKKQKDSAIDLKLFKEELKIGLLKIHPNMYAEEFMVFKDFDGLVVEGTGLGHMPISVIDDHTKEHERIFDSLKALITNDVLIAMSPQTIYGRIQMNVYAPGRELIDAGVIGNYSDMTPETTFIKLAWLLSNYSHDEARKLLCKNLRGELLERTDEESFLN